MDIEHPAVVQTQATLNLSAIERGFERGQVFATKQRVGDTLGECVRSERLRARHALTDQQETAAQEQVWPPQLRKQGKRALGERGARGVLLKRTKNRGVVARSMACKERLTFEQAHPRPSCKGKRDGKPRHATADNHDVYRVAVATGHERERSSGAGFARQVRTVRNQIERFLRHASFHRRLRDR
jgi:hypothetical protein